jgi:exopolysaccharide biosynthesis polyprenyl glycosylphosphotransferase
MIVGIAGKVVIGEKPFLIEYGVSVLATFLLASAILPVSRLFIVHIVFSSWLKRHFRRQVVIVGSNEEARRIGRHIIESDAPFWVVGAIGSTDAQVFLDIGIEKCFLGSLNKLPDVVKTDQINEIIITDEAINKKTLIALLDYCTTQGVNAWFSPELMPIIDIKLHIDNFCGLPLIRLCSQKNSWLFNKVKHSLDTLMTLPGFVALLPLTLSIAAVIKVESKGPVLYSAKAIGRNGQLFSMYKFRSMQANTSHEMHKDYVSRLIKGQIGTTGSADKPLKITNDPRVTRVGRILRKTSLDELPQLINVLKGEMSLVGPRPCLPYEYEIYKEWHKKRTIVRPGITGLWQVAGRSQVAFEDMILLDLYYIYNRSVMMDFNILWETIFTVLAKKGAY